MRGLGALVRLFLRDLVRRRFLWALVVLTVGVIGLNYGINRGMQEELGNGSTWDVATHRATSQLDGLATTLRTWIPLAVALLAAQLAPESRRNGTTQFVLSLGVRRDVLAATQFVAFAIVLSAGLLILHAGFAMVGLRVGAVRPAEVSVAWVTLLASQLAWGACVFALSLTASALETYLVFLGIPFAVRTLPGLMHGFPRGFPLALVRAFDNVGLLFPESNELVTWPHLSFGAASGPPHPEWHWALVQGALAVAFWVVLGLWLQWRHDFGSRAALT